jgi:hypothetical protein
VTGREPRCSVCGYPAATPIRRERLREGVAAWITHLCEKCEPRFAPLAVAEPEVAREESHHARSRAV